MATSFYFGGSAVVARGDSAAVPVVSVRPDRLSIFFQSSGRRSSIDRSGWSSSVPGESAPEVTAAKSIEVGKKAKRPNTTKSGARLSVKATRRIQDKIEWLCFFAKTKRAYNPKSGNSFKFRVNFVTLTLPVLQRHRDTTIKSVCLNQFLTEARKYCGLRNYVWRGECQKNGNIHFHIVTDTYLNAYLIRSIWNRQLAKLGYIQAYSNNFSNLNFLQYRRRVDPLGHVLTTILLNRYNHGVDTNWSAPNTTDVHSTKKIRNLVAYLKKYVSKKIDPGSVDQVGTMEGRRIVGRLWGCSQSLSKITSACAYVDLKVNEFLNYCADKDIDRVFQHDHGTVIYCRVRSVFHAARSFLTDFFTEFLKKVKYRPCVDTDQKYFLTSKFSFA